MTALKQEDEDYRGKQPPSPCFSSDIAEQNVASARGLRVNWERCAFLGPKVIGNAQRDAQRNRLRRVLPKIPLVWRDESVFQNLEVAIGYTKLVSRSHDAVIRVYDETGNAIETHEHAGDFKRVVSGFSVLAPHHVSDPNEPFLWLSGIERYPQFLVARANKILDTDYRLRLRGRFCGLADSGGG